jgi:hypothetical protein
MSELAESLDHLARVLEGNKDDKKKRILYVAAFALINRKGKPTRPEAINPGDDLFVMRPEQPGAGIVSKDAAGRPYAKALEFIAAGEMKQITAAVFEKRWVTDADPCPECDENALVGWIDGDDVFPSDDDEPPVHPNCRCSLETRRVGE